MEKVYYPMTERELAFFRKRCPNMDPSGFVYDPKAALERKLNMLLEEVGDLPYYDCPKCKNRGTIPRIDDDRIVYRVCDCRDIRLTMEAMAKSGLKDVMENYTFARFEENEPWQKAAKKAAVDYAEDPKGWFFICGQSGSGKSHLCTAIAREVMLKGKKLVYMPWREDATAIKSMKGDDPRRETRLTEIKSAPVLYIDDLLKTAAGLDGRTVPTNADINLAFEIINYRYLSDLPTIVSTELYPEELTAIDEATAGRILEKAKGKVLRITRDKRRNYRLKSVLEL